VHERVLVPNVGEYLVEGKIESVLPARLYIYKGLDDNKKLVGHYNCFSKSKNFNYCLELFKKEVKDLKVPENEFDKLIN